MKSEPMASSLFCGLSPSGPLRCALLAERGLHFAGILGESEEVDPALGEGHRFPEGYRADALDEMEAAAGSCAPRPPAVGSVRLVT